MKRKDLENEATKIAAVVKSVIRPNVGYIVLTFGWGEGGSFAYASNADREGAHNLLAEFLFKRGGRHAIRISDDFKTMSCGCGFEPPPGVDADDAIAMHFAALTAERKLEPLMRAALARGREGAGDQQAHVHHTSKCPCGSVVQVVSIGKPELDDDLGNISLVHGAPPCSAYIDLDPGGYLEYLRTGRMPGAAAPEGDPS